MRLVPRKTQAAKKRKWLGLRKLCLDQETIIDVVKNRTGFCSAAGLISLPLHVVFGVPCEYAGRGAHNTGWAIIHIGMQFPKVLTAILFS